MRVPGSSLGWNEAFVFFDSNQISGEDLYKLHASVLILILLFQFVFTMYKLI